MTDKEIIQKIKLAREWAKNHFNAAQAEDAKMVEMVDGELQLTRATFYVEFPDADRMVATPSFFGRKGSIYFEYRLCFNPLQWEGKHPFYGTPMPPLKVQA